MAKDDEQVLQEYNLAASQDTVTLKMAVSDGHVVDFLWQEAGEWKTALDAYDAGPLVPWGMGFRVGLAAKGNGGQVRVTQFAIKNH